MKNKIIKSSGKNYSAINIGSFTEIGQYSYPHPKLKQDIAGKLFIGELIQSTGIEVSFQEIPAHTKIPFLHAHQNHEEVYIFLKGEGAFQVDDAIIEVKEGTVIRVAPSGKRTWKNDSDKAMVLIVIQAKANSLKGFNVSDGHGTNGDLLL